MQLKIQTGGSKLKLGGQVEGVTEDRLAKGACRAEDSGRGNYKNITACSQLLALSCTYSRSLFTQFLLLKSC